MPAKLPGKFDDISKTAASALDDDFECKGYKLKSKQKTALGGATAEVNVDVLTGKEQAAKLNFKFPKPLAEFPGLAIDKLELTKSGEGKIECSLTKELHGVDGLKLEVKSDLNKKQGSCMTYSTTYTGIADTSVKLETKHQKPGDFTLECLRAIDCCVVGAKITPGSLCPLVGVSVVQKGLFASILAKNQFSEFTPHVHYKVSDDIQVAATYQHGGEKSGAWSVGCSASLASVVKGLSVKSKFDSTQTLSVTTKKDLAAGATLFSGVAYNVSGGSMTYGAKLNIE